MKQKIQFKNIDSFKMYPITIAVMAFLQMMAIMYGRHFIDLFFGWHVALGNLIFTPMIIFIFQIVSEVYGWQYARQIVWCNFTFNLLATFFTLVMSYVPYSAIMNQDLKMSYIYFVDTMWVSCFINCIVIFCSDYVSIVVTSISRFIFRGRFMVLRLFAVHCLSEGILLTGGAVGYLYNHYTIIEVLHLQINMFFIRLITALIMTPAVYLTIWLLQHKIEQIIAFDINKNLWNIFRWTIDKNKMVKLNAEQWSQLSEQEKRQVNFGKQY